MAVENISAIAFKLCIVFWITNLSFCQERCQFISEHLCQSDGRCIAKRFVCDGKKDCFDGSDETSDLCLNRPCSERHEHSDNSDPFGLTLGVMGEAQSFRCSYGACVSKTSTCNGVDNCNDGSDESLTLCKNIVCKPGEFKCAYGGCIKSFQICNGIQNCHDGSDETSHLCLDSRRVCLQSQGFKCAYGGCIPKFWRCNGRADCPDLSDETNCGPGHTYTPYVTMRVNIEPEPLPPPVDTPAIPPPDTGLSKGCRQEAAQGENFQLFQCGVDNDDQLCRGSGLLPAGTIIVVLCYGKEADDVLQCDDRGLWRSVDAGGATGPTSLICESQQISGCVGSHHGEGSVRVLFCGDGGACSGSAFYPTGTLILSECGQIILQCREDNIWHHIQEEMAPAYEACPTSLITADQGCPSFRSPGVSYETVLCGGGLDVSSCRIGSSLPRGTVILARCAQLATEPLILQCHSDNKWHQLGHEKNPPMTQACVYETPNYQDCGARKEQGVDFPWTWLVGLFRENKFACTGTLIAPSLIITGGHCVVRNQASRDKIAPEELIIQHAIPGNRFTKSKVASILLHPLYSGGDKPRFDVALIRLSHPAIRDDKIQPACLDTRGALIGRVAMTFNRTEGQEHYSWSIFPQAMDVTCVNLNSLCSRHLKIDQYQFCGYNQDNNLFLHPGSSGGPYLINLGSPTNERWAVAGIVSHKVETKDQIAFCRRPHTVFLSVSKVYDWIIRCGFSNNCGV